MKNYVLLTAAHNEENYIENTILSVINQTHRPSRWIIVNDGSSDATEHLIRKYSDSYSFIKLINNFRKDGRDFASKVYALKIGIQSLDYNDFEYIGILDADITFTESYYSEIIKKFENNPKLGIAGGIFFDVVNEKLVPVYPSPFSIRGAVQFFNRRCFEQIGELIPIKYGGEDTVTCIAAKMNGWEILNFQDLVVMHHRKTGTADRNIFSTRFRDGFVEYHLGYHPIFQFLKCIKRIKEEPFFIGSFLRFSGFWWANIKREKRTIPDDIIKFFRKEQISRISTIDY
jgi:poly-beta-1,6-N-acetyl-D-glucosamine synthase